LSKKKEKDFFNTPGVKALFMGLGVNPAGGVN